MNQRKPILLLLGILFIVMSSQIYGAYFNRWNVEELPFPGHENCVLNLATNDPTEEYRND